ncbi:MAG: transposase, partial [Thermocrispum sp.]
FVTSSTADAVTVDRFHRDHATVELAIGDLKEGAGLAHCPSGRFPANGAWLACAVLAHNLFRWTNQLGGIRHLDELTVAATQRTRLIAVPGRLVNRSGTPTLRLPTHWPWARPFNQALSRLRTLRPVPV